MTTEEEIRSQQEKPEDDELAHLLPPASLETPWFKTIIQSVKEAINPPKLPPLEVTSKPIEVPDVWGFYGQNKSKARVMSVFIHIGIIFLILWLGSLKPVQKMVQNVMPLFMPDLKPYLPDKPKDNQQHGGGGGGTRSPLDASKGKLPKIAPRQFTPPRVEIRRNIPSFRWNRPSWQIRRFRISTR